MIRKCLLVVMVATCSGCVGIAFDRTKTVSIEKPVPLGHRNWLNSGFERWACQPDLKQAYRTKSDFIAKWGEPHSKELSGNKETWIYAESGRWCGLWIGLVVVPVPLLLPVCETYDKIAFENDRAVSATSSRFVVTATGIAIAGAAGMPIPIPVPFYIRAGEFTENDSSVGTFPSSDKDISCIWKPPAQ